jgi:broad specificity phosphatase PhoE
VNWQFHFYVIFSAKRSTHFRYHEHCGQRLHNNNNNNNEQSLALVSSWWNTDDEKMADMNGIPTTTTVNGTISGSPTKSKTKIINRYYPIGTPGVSWTPEEDNQWKKQCQKHRSYDQDVLHRLTKLRDDGILKSSGLRLHEYGHRQVNGIVMTDEDTASNYKLMAVVPETWNTSPDAINVLVTGGVHGYETSGVHGAIHFVEVDYASVVQSTNGIPINLVVCPCVTPWAYEHIQRWNSDLQDPNRSFKEGNETPESKAVMTFVQSLREDHGFVEFDIHLDLHETTDTDATEFMPAKHAKAGLDYEDETIPDGFYLVGDEKSSAGDIRNFHRAVLQAVSKVTHLAPPDDNGCIIDVPITEEGLILVPARELGICGGGATPVKYVGTTEVYPDSRRLPDDNTKRSEVCNQAQSAAIRGAIDYLVAKRTPANESHPSQPQYLFVIRHGDRWDYSNPDWTDLPKKRTGDSPLSTLGHLQARETGQWLDEFLSEHKLSPNDVVWLSSPFLRCLQTSDGALNAFTKTDPTSIAINVEYSIFEWDGHNGSWHADLPSVTEERQHYFPRINVDYESVFVPEIPEPRSKFFERCDRSVAELLTKRYPYRPNQVIVMVSHAAGCLALSKALTGLPLNKITPAGPCSIYGFTRQSDTAIWTVDEHDAPSSLNGYTDHLSDMGTATSPWHNFGDGVTKFYTGPPTSRFAPPPDAGKN